MVSETVCMRVMREKRHAHTHTHDKGRGNSSSRSNSNKKLGNRMEGNEEPSIIFHNKERRSRKREEERTLGTR